MNKNIFIALLLLFGGVYAKAQDSLYGQSYSLKDALDYALKFNTRIQNAQLTEQEKELYTREVRSAALPQISGSTSLTHNYLLPVLIFQGQQVSIGTQNNAVAGVNLSQQIYNQSIFTGLKAAKAGATYYELNTKLTEEEVIEGVSQLYYQALITSRQLEYVNKNLDQVNKLLEISTSQYENGLIKKVDLSRIQVNKTNLISQQKKLETAYIQQLNLLKYNMGLTVEDELLLEHAEIHPLEEQTLIVDNHIDNHTQLQLLGQQETLLKLEEKSFKAGYYPTVSLSFNYQYNMNSDNFNFSESNANVARYDVGAIGLSVNIPIFDGFKKKYQVQQNKVRQHQLVNSMRDTRTYLDVQFMNALNSLETSKSTLVAQEENMELALEVYDVTQETYQYGLASLTDLLNAETALTQAQTEYATALLSYKVAEIDLLKSKGDIRLLLQ